jgi:hypothetical protein
MTMSLKRSKYWREYVADEFVAATMNADALDALLAAEAVELNISNTEWLTLRLSALAGVDLHSSEGRRLHGADAAVRPRRMFEGPLGERVNWDW